MSILNYLPTFKVVEINRSTGLVTGHVLSQFVLKSTSALINTTNGIDFLENGFIVGLNNDLEILEFDPATHAQPFLVYVEELNELMDGLKYYATEEDADGDIYPRAIALYVGDAFTTNNYVTSTTPAFAKVVAGVLTMQDAADVDTLFAVEVSTLPDGSAVAYKFIYLGRSVEALVTADIATHAALTTGVHGL